MVKRGMKDTKEDDFENEEPRKPKAEGTILSSNLFLMRLTGMWPYASSDANFWARFAQASYCGFMVVCNISFFAFKLIHTILAAQDITSLTENICDILCISFTLAQLLVLVRRRKEMLTIVVQVESEFWRMLKMLGSSDSSSTKRHLKRSCRLLTALGVGTNFTSAINFMIYMYLAKSEEKLALPIRIWTPFSQVNSPTWEILFLFEVMGVLTSVAGAGAICALTTSLVLVVAAQYRILRRAFEKRDEIRKNPWEEFVLRIKLHQTVLRLSEMLINALSKLYTFQLAITVLILCLAVFQVSTDPLDFNRNVRYYVLGLTVLITSFIICWISMDFSDEGSEIQYAIERGEWAVEDDKRIRKAMPFILLRAQKAPLIAVGPSSVNVNLPTYLELVRSSYSIFTVLNKKRTDELV